jgi:hypothetical protein
MARLPGNVQLLDSHGRPLSSLRAVNELAAAEKERIYAALIPPRLFELFAIDPGTLTNQAGERVVSFIAPAGLGLVRLEVREHPAAADPLFFLDLADTQFGQMELAFCIISNPAAPRFAVDRDPAGKDNWFASKGRNIAEEVRAMTAGLFPNQTRQGLRLFAEFFPIFERFVDGLGIEMIVAEPLTYDNAIRYEGYGFDYLTGRRLMLEINRGFAADGLLTGRLDGSTPFRTPGMEKSVRGRSWAIHDGILDEPWDDIRIYKMVGVHAGINTFPEREKEE